jgi:hypothetical protein
MKVFFIICVHSLKETKTNCKFKYSRWITTAAESKWALPCSVVARRIRAARPKWWKDSGDWGGLQALQPREGLKEDFVCLFTLLTSLIL